MDSNRLLDHHLEMGGIQEDLFDEDVDDELHWSSAPSRLDIGDCDAFFTVLYRYWISRGLTGVVFKQLSSVISLAFTVAFSSFLIGFIRWRHLLRDCRGGDNSECHTF